MLRYRLGKLTFIILTLLALLTRPLAIKAQQDAGAIVVLVSDPSSSAVPGAAVSIVNTGTNATVKGKTNDIGAWTATPLLPGQYRVTVTLQGFQTTVVDPVSVELQKMTRVPVTLTVGDTSQQLTVTSTAEILQTEDTTNGQLISGPLKDDLPVSDRDFNRLATLTVGVSLSNPSGPRDTASAAFSANGVTQYQNNYVLDGTDNNSYDQNINEGRTFAIEPSLDAIAEFKVLTNAYSAEFGRNGGAVVNVITKSGTNSFHGSGYEYFQTSDANANDFFNNALNIPLSAYHQNIFGATFGGPVRIPRIYDGRNKSFFFVDFERQPHRSPGSLNEGLVPTPAEVSGNFSGQTAIYDPLTGSPFPNNTIPGSRINPIAAKIAAAIPSPNISGANNYFKEGPRNTDDNRFAFRADQKLSDKDNFFARYQLQDQNQPQVGLFAGTILSGDDNVTANAQGVVANETHTFGPNLINEARFGWTRLDWKGVPVYSGQNINSQVGIQGTPIQAGITGGLAAINFTNGLSGFGGANVEEDLNGVYQGSDTLTWVNGRHSLKLGVDYRHISFLSNASSFAPIGEFDFDGHYTAGSNSNGNPFADFLLDLPYQSRLSAIHTDDYQRRSWSAFVQDDFKLSRRLTLNFGLRWDYVTPVWEANNHGAALDPYNGVLNIPGYTGTLPAETQRQVNAGIISINTNSNKYFGVKPDHHDFGPRFGFAYLIDSKTVFRAGYGLYYGPEELGLYGEPSAGFSVPFLQQASYTPLNSNPTSLNPVTMATGFPATALTNPTTPTLFALDPGLRTPYIQQWNATLQRELTPTTTLEISYIGSKTTAMYTTLDWNIPSLSTNPNAPYAPRQPFPAVDPNGSLIPGAAIQGPNNDGMGKYDALGVKFEKRMSRNVSVISAWTWAHDIDNITNSGLSVGNNGRSSYPSYQIKNQKGNSDWDVPNRWVSGFVLALPFGRGERFGNNIDRWTDLFLGGWQVSGIFTVESGMWFTVNQSYDSGNIGGTSLCGNCRQRPDVVLGQNPNDGPHQVDPSNPNVHWFNVDAFTRAANGTIGNAGRNIVQGPGLANIDASLGKVFRLREGLTMQFRTEAFNATNSTNFLATSGATNPSGFILGHSNFGDLTADRGGRVLQFVGRLVF
jgi:hypothetical protein